MTKGKRIFIAHNWTDASICQQSKALALSFSRENEVVFLSAKKTGKGSFFVNERLQVVEWPGKRPVTFRDLLFAFKLMLKHKPDIIVTNFAANNIMLFVSWWFGVKVRMSYYHTLVEQYISDNNRLDLNQKLRIYRKSFFFKKATHILPPSTAAAADFRKYYPFVDQNKIHVFPNAIMETTILNKGITGVIGFAGRFNRSKGIDILIKAFINIAPQFPEVKLAIAGKGELEDELKKLIEIAGLKERVLWKGYISSSEVVEFIAGLTFLVVPSRIDNLPTVVLEAFSTATPVIGARKGGIPDMVKDNMNGLLFEAEDSEDLGKKIETLLSNTSLREELGKIAYKTFKEKYSIENLRDRFENLLAETIN